MDDSADSAHNSLGLDLDALRIKDDPEGSGSSQPVEAETTQAPTKAEETDSSKPTETAEQEPAEDEAKSPISETKRSEQKEKKVPYVNPERVKTGGAQRDKLSEEELTERMARIREQNEKIKQRRMDVQADEEAFRKTQEVERQKAAKNKKVQETIDRTREQNARRKLDKIQSREWDSGKPARDWKPANKPEDGDDTNKPPRASIGIRGATRGGFAGRGRGRGGAPLAPAAPFEASEKVAEQPAPTPPAAEAAAAS